MDILHAVLALFPGLQQNKQPTNQPTQLSCGKGRCGFMMMMITMTKINIKMKVKMEKRERERENKGRGGEVGEK